MTFRSAPILWLLAAIPLLLVFLAARESVRTRIARRLVSERLRGVSVPARLLRPWLLALGLVAAIVALAGPYSGFELVPVTVREGSLVIAIDVSNSMSAEDVGTSRIAAAKAIARRLVDAHSGRVALVAFEATAEVMAPLTSDAEAVVTLIDSLAPGELAEPGSDIGTAVITALTLIEGETVRSTQLVILSDGEEQGSNIAAAASRARSRNAIISSVLLGSKQGSTIRTPRGPMRDESGVVITTYARTDSLRELASKTGGVMLENPFADRALEPLLRGRPGERIRQTHARVPVDRYQWPLALSFVLLLGASLLNRGAE